MEDAERYWAVASGIAGLVCLVSGSLLASPGPVDRPIDEVVASLIARRSAVLTGAVLTATAGTLLTWPIAAVVTFPEPTWPSLGLFSLGLAVLGAAAKVATVVVESAGTGRREGWNAGGWAAGVSGYVTVIWYALVLAALA